MRFRVAKETDIEAMVGIIRATFPKDDAKTAKEEILHVMANTVSRRLFIVAEEAGSMVGLAGLIQSWMDFNLYEVFWVAVSPAYQKRGVGSRLIAQVVRRAKAIRGHSRVNAVLVSTESPAFFAKCGFKTLMRFPGDGGCLMSLGIQGVNALRGRGATKL